MNSISPTPYPDVNEILYLLLSHVQEVLGDQFVAMYLYGSLSSGDFDPEMSDIDFLVVTADLLSDQKIAALESMHGQLWSSGLQWASRLEGAYIPQKDIRRYHRDSPPAPTVNEGRFSVGAFGSDWIIQRHVIREWGVVLAGPDPRALIDPISVDDIRGAVLGVLHEWWFPMLDDSTWLREHGGHYHGFAIITMCRALHTLHDGIIVSKPAAVEWAKEELGSQWRSLIEQAVASPDGKRSDLLNETLEFIRFTREQIAKYEGLTEDRK